MTTLLTLASRVEEATGPDRELDCLIYEMDDLRAHGPRLNLTPEMRGTYYGEPTGRYFDISEQNPRELPYVAPAYTSSLDAAMSLVPEGEDYSLERVGGEHWASVDSNGERLPCVRGESPALALTAACLRARAQGQPS